MNAVRKHDDGESDVVRALTTSVATLESSRRVGWARAYEADNRTSNLERDLSITRGDMALMTKFAAFMFGALNELGTHSVFDANQDLPYVPDIKKMASFLPDAATNAGKSAATRWKESAESHATKVMEGINTINRTRSAGRNLFKRARRQMQRQMREQYGFRSDEELFDWLAVYRWSKPSDIGL